MLREAFAKNPKLAGTLVPLTAAIIAMQAINDRDDMRRQPAIEPKSVKNAATASFGGAGLPFEYSLAALSGFRQVIAGLLWVRSDAFFHSGNYDAILPMIRLITWLDPNWLDVYATGAWHLMYNFTDTDQRSDRRYLPVGLALLDEGIANNPKVFDVYKEKGWNMFDKVRDYNGAVKAYQGALTNDPDAEVNQVVHPLAHSYERAGMVDEAIATWDDAIKRHQEWMKRPGITDEVKMRNEMGTRNATKNRSIMQIRKALRPGNIAALGQVNTDFHVTVTRTKAKVIKVEGSWNLIGSIKDTFDAGVFEADGNTVKILGKGITLDGPVNGCRVDVRLQDDGYKMPEFGSFSFEVDPKITLMQDIVTTSGGRQVDAGGAYIATPRAGNAEAVAESAKVYNLAPKDQAIVKGVPVAQALAGGVPISARGQWQLVTIAYPKAFNAYPRYYTQAEIPAMFAKLRGDAKTVADKLTKRNVHIARQGLYAPGTFRREIDMSKDPKMYGFKGDKFELILSVNPRTAPDFVQDRIGWNGEGWNDKNFLDDKTIPGVRMIRVRIPLSKDDIVGSGEKVLYKG